MLTLLKKIFGTKSEKQIRELREQVEEINRYYETLSSLSDDDLRGKTREIKQQLHEALREKTEEKQRLTEQAQKIPDSELSKKEELFKKADEVEKEILKLLEKKLDEYLVPVFAILKETTRRWKEKGELRVRATDWDRQIAQKRSNVVIDGEWAIWKNKWIAAGNEITWDMVYYDVQLIGGIVLHKGKIAEMATGEGKTLVSTLPVFLNALSGRGVHVVTVNNYLSRRDCEWNGPLYQFHGLSVDCIDLYEPHSEERRKAYACDITYGTNNEFGFDYLRDNMARSLDEIVQRGHHYAIVDEVDSVLIDDARTPLIISGPTPKGDKHEFDIYKPRVEKLVNIQKQSVIKFLNEAKRLLSEGKEKEAGVPLLRAYRGLPKNNALIKFLSEPGVKTLLQKTENYYMQDQNREMHKIDAELYFFIDEKNKQVDLTEKGIEFITAQTEDPKFFVIPNVADELAEIEKTITDPAEKNKAKEALMLEFSIKSERIHTVQQLLKAYTLFEKDVDYVIDNGQVKIVDEQTGRILEGRRYSDGLHQAIEAKENVKIEAATQTYATITLQNYFRMYHKLAGMTGTASTEAQEFWDIYKLEVVEIPTHRPVIRIDHEDLIFKTKREKYNAVIEEIVKLVNQGRPVLVGTTSVEISELLSRMLKLRHIKHNVLNAKLHAKEAEIVAEAGKAGTVTIATNMAGRGTDIKLGPGVKEAGGLAIIGTERHESRRVDRQLRGRAGRQGDPGSSQFFVSLEDDLMRLFGSERIARMMDKWGAKEGEVLQHSWLTGTIERAQKKVEENNFGIRKRLIEYDDVMNAQREVIYKRRRNALYGDKLSIDLANMMLEIADNLVTEYRDLKDFDSFQMELIRIFGTNAPIDEKTFLSSYEEELINSLFLHVEKHYRDKCQHLIQLIFPVVRDIYSRPDNRFENMLVPLTDGLKTMQFITHLKTANETDGKSIISDLEKSVVLYMIDDAWKEHLREMDDLKQAVQNAALEQKDPLVVYKLESFQLFKQMILKLNKDIISFLMKAHPPREDRQAIEQTARFSIQTPVEKKEKLTESRSSNDEPVRKRPKIQPVRNDIKIGRNDPCPCGSGLKYKNCHGKNS